MTFQRGQAALALATRAEVTLDYDFVTAAYPVGLDTTETVTLHAVHGQLLARRLR